MEFVISELQRHQRIPKRAVHKILRGMGNSNPSQYMRRYLESDPRIRKLDNHYYWVGDA